MYSERKKVMVVWGWVLQEGFGGHERDIIKKHEKMFGGDKYIIFLCYCC